ncbi:MAG: heme lyase CcmF/NrfE family subunit [Nitrospinota bacterium]
MIELGEISLLTALITSIYSLIVSFWGGFKENQLLAKSGQNAMFATFGLLSLASVILMRAFLTNDYSIQYVYSYSNADLATFYKVSAFWGGQKGSLLLWGWMLSMFATIVILQNRKHNQRLIPYVVGVLAITVVLFCWLMVGATPVFERMAAIPPDGYGLNPMLQNPGMVFHPPSLYIGFVGFTIPYSFAMAALIRRQIGDVWIRSTRRWLIFAWFFLTMGNLLGANWAYVELGWGGYWAWDPVENASFMPWLVGTAYLHSVMIQEKKDMLKIWNVTLITITYALTIFGTFITRSGLIASVHSFGETTVGMYFGIFLIIIIVFSTYMIVSRRDLLRSKNKLDSIVSRESSFLFNNLMLLGAAFAVFWGTTFPMISEAVRGVKITVGPPFFNTVMIPISGGLLLLTGLCPLLAWRKATMSNLKKNFMVPLGVSLIVGVILAALGVRHLIAWLFFALCAFVTATILMELIRGSSARMFRSKENPVKALYKLISRNKRRYGGYIIHIGVVCMFIGFSGNAFNEKKEASLRPGESMTINDYTLTYYGYEVSNPKPSKEEVVANLLVEKDGKKIGFLRPEKNFYMNFNQPNSEVAIRSTMKEDIYAIFASLSSNGKATFQIHINPLVKWLWVGGMIMGIGTIIAMWPDRRERKRFEARHAETVTGHDVLTGNEAVPAYGKSGPVPGKAYSPDS